METYTMEEFAAAMVTASREHKADHFIIVNSAHFEELCTNGHLYIDPDDRKIYKASSGKPCYFYNKEGK